MCKLLSARKPTQIEELLKELEKSNAEVVNRAREEKTNPGEC
jgi:hypothetical protein